MLAVVKSVVVWWCLMIVVVAVACTTDIFIVFVFFRSGAMISILQVLYQTY
jgi:hypothetical protein